MTDAEESTQVTDGGLVGHPVQEQEDSTGVAEDCIVGGCLSSEDAKFRKLRFADSDQRPDFRACPVHWMSESVKQK